MVTTFTQKVSDADVAFEGIVTVCVSLFFTLLTERDKRSLFRCAGTLRRQ